MKRYSIIIVLILLIFPPIHLLFAAEKSLNYNLLNSIRENNLKSVRKLIERGADPFFEDSEGRQAAEIAIDRGFFKIAHYLQAFQIQNKKTLSIPKDSLSIYSKLDVDEDTTIGSPIHNENLPQLHIKMR